MERLRRYFRRPRLANDQDATHEINVRQVLESHSARQILHLESACRQSSVASSASSESEQRRLELLEEGVAEDESGILSEYCLNESFLARAVQVHPASNSHPEALLALRWTASAFKELRLEVRSSSAPLHSTDAGGSTDVSARVEERACSVDPDEALQLFHEVVSLANEQISLPHAAQSAPTSHPGLSKEAATILLNALYLAHLPDPLVSSEEADSSRPERSMLDSVLAGALAAHKILSVLTRILTPGSRRRGAERFCNAVTTVVGGIAFTGVCRINRMMVSESSRRRPMPAIGGQSPLMPTLLVQCPLCRECTVASHAIRNVRAGDSVPVCCVCTDSASDVCLPCGHLCLCQTCFSQMPRQSAQSTSIV